MTTPFSPARPTRTRSRRWLAELRGLLAVALLVLGLHSLVAKPFYIPSESMLPGLQVGDHLLVSRFPYGWSYASAAFHFAPRRPGRWWGRLPARGDVVIVNPPDDARRGTDLIKRVVGLPGDRVQMKAGRLWLNGRPVRTAPPRTLLLPVDANLHCDADDPDPERAFPGYLGRRLTDRRGRAWCRLTVVRETLPGGASYDTLDFGRTAVDDTPAVLVPPGHVFVLGDNRDDSADSRVAVAQGGLGGPVAFDAVGGRAEFVAYSLNGSAGWNPLSWGHPFRADRFGVSLRPATPARHAPVNKPA